MSEDSTALAGVEAVSDPEETEEATNEVETEGQSETETENQDDSGEGEGEQEEAEEIEFDFGGNKLKVPKDSIPPEVAEQLDKFTKGTWSDYTRKSQEAAERSKSLEAKEQAVERLFNMNGEVLQTFSRGLAVQNELQQLRNIDLNALWQSDRDQARRVSDLISQKQAELQSIANTVGQKEQELTRAQQAELARRMDEGKQATERMQKGFSQKAPEVVDYVVKSYGMSKEEAETWPLNPRMAVMAYKAMLFDRMQTNVKPKPAPKVAQADPVRPMKAKGSATASKDPDKMSVDEWMKWRNSQLRKRG